MVDFSASLLRADDLLVLTFECVNLTLATPAGGAPSLARIDPARPAYLVVVLPPQHIAEQVFDENQQGQLPGVQQPPVPSYIAGPSRLVFRLPDGVATVPFTVEALLRWADYAPSLPVNARDEQEDVWEVGPAPVSPLDTQTAIELPYRLLLSPERLGGWRHATVPVTRDGSTELWHTRLGRPDQQGRIDDRRPPVLRAVWALDMGPGVTERQGLSLDAPTRIGITKASSDFSPSKPWPGTPNGIAHRLAPPIRTTHLALSALGAWADLQGIWDNVADVATGQIWDYGVAAWRHLVGQGRDQQVLRLNTGFLYPLGHRADLSMTIERKVRPAPDGQPVGYLASRGFIHVQQRVLDYHDSAGNLLPFRRVEIRTTDTPLLSNATGRPVFVPMLDAVPFRFEVLAWDWDDHPVHLQMPLVFVPDGRFAEAPAAYAPYAQVDLFGQPVALAPALSPTASAAPDSGIVSAVLPVTTLQVTHADLPGRYPPFLPHVAQALVGLPAVDQLIGSGSGAGQVWITLVDPAASHSDTFATISPQRPVSLSLPAQQAGGIAAPTFGVANLSRSLGPLPDVLGADGNLDTGKIVQAFAGTTLLGVVDLASLISGVIDANAPFAQVPKLVQTRHPDRIETTLHWNPPLRVPDTGAFRLDPHAVLSITSTTVLPIGSGGAPGPPGFTVDGRLTLLTLNFVDIMSVTIEELRFTAETGKKVHLDPKGIGITLGNALQFLNELADALPADGFSDPPELKVTAEGVTAGYSLGIPAAGIGIFSLENLRLSAALSLPFVAKPAGVRLAFSERAHPFLVSVSGIGGGGFCAIEVDTKRIVLVEASIEVGANLTIGLGVIEANAHVMAGFYFAVDDSGVQFSGYLRIGGSVELLGIAGVSIDIYLALTYESAQASVGGIATVTVAVHLLFFSTSISLTAERHFPFPQRGAQVAPAALDAAAAGEEIGFAQIIGDWSVWQRYCQAFAS